MTLCSHASTQCVRLKGKSGGYSTIRYGVIFRCTPFMHSYAHISWHYSSRVRRLLGALPVGEVHNQFCPKRSLCIIGWPFGWERAKEPQVPIYPLEKGAIALGSTLFTPTAEWNPATARFHAERRLWHLFSVSIGYVTTCATQLLSIHPCFVATGCIVSLMFCLLDCWLHRHVAEHDVSYLLMVVCLLSHVW